MTITHQDIINRFGLSSSENLQMFVMWIDFSPSQRFPQKSKQQSVPNGIQLDVGQFAYVTLKSGAGKHVFSAYILVNSENSFIKTTYHRISLTHFMMFGQNCKDRVADFWNAYKKADETVSIEESMPLPQRLEMLAKRSGGSCDKFIKLAKAHDVINGFDPKQVAEIKRFWDSWILSQQTQQAPQTSFPAQSPFSGQQQPVQIASGPLQSPFATQQTPQVAPPAQSPFAEQQSIQAPTTPSMAPQAYQTQVPQATLEGIYSLLQQLLAANTAQASVTAP